MEKRVEVCVKRMLREERGITADLNREVGRIEERVNRAERYMREEVREELDRSVRERRGNTDRVKGTGKRNRDKGGERSVGVEEVNDADAEAPPSPLPAIIEIRGVPGASYAGA